MCAVRKDYEGRLMAVTDAQPCPVSGPAHDYQDMTLTAEQKAGLLAVAGFDADAHEQCTKCQKTMPKD